MFDTMLVRCSADLIPDKALGLCFVENKNSYDVYFYLRDLVKNGTLKSFSLEDNRLTQNKTSSLGGNLIEYKGGLYYCGCKGDSLYLYKLQKPITNLTKILSESGEHPVQPGTVDAILSVDKSQLGVVGSLDDKLFIMIYDFVNRPANLRERFRVMFN